MILLTYCLILIHLVDEACQLPLSTVEQEGTVQNKISLRILIENNEKDSWVTDNQKDVAEDYKGVLNLSLPMLAKPDAQKLEVRGWLFNRRSSSKKNCNRSPKCCQCRWRRRTQAKGCSQLIEEDEGYQWAGVCCCFFCFLCL